VVFAYDPELASAVATPPATIPEVIRIMQTIDRLCIAADGLKWFNQLYLDVTNAVGGRVAAGGFADPAWLAALDVQFACLYFSALRSSLTGAAAPGCWRALFERRNQSAIARIQFALAGVNAHINHDLPIAIVSACEAFGSAPCHVSAHYSDYTKVNATLESIVNTAKQQLHVRLLGDALPPVSHLEDTIAAFSVTAAREAAWNNAEMLWILRGAPPIRDRTLSSLDGLTALAGKTLLVPIPVPQAGCQFLP
jgi:hypothetical protein